MGFFQRRVQFRPGLSASLEGAASLYRLVSNRYNVLSRKGFFALPGM